MSRKKSRFWSEGAGSFAIAIGIALIIRWAFMEAYVIPSGSMLPSLLINDHIFVNKITYGVRVPFTTDWLTEFSDPKRGDVIVFKYPSDPDLYYIKRVIGVPGDSILYENGNLYLNQELVNREVPQGVIKKEWNWLSDNDFVGELNAEGLSNYSHWQESLGEKNYSVLLRRDGSRQLEFGPYKVPARHYFVMGDNRDNSQDSRFWASESMAAEGDVVFSRKDSRSDSNIPIPEGTIVSTEEIDGRSVRYRTIGDAVVEGASAKVKVEAVELGPMGNASPGKVSRVESETLDDLLVVTNQTPIVGGEDQRFVPREFVVGRAMFVWLSCEETLPVFSFLCNPLDLRWGRFFHKIN